MTPTILIDLDDTLLDNSTTAFIPAYVDALCKHLSRNTVSAELIYSALISATEKMHQNTDPSKTLKEVFDAHFYPSLGWDHDLIMPQIAEFYRTVYPRFRELTSPNPAGRDAIKSLFQNSSQIVIATNPIFPQDAVQQRLVWSDLQDEIPKFSLITSYEEQHFTKPHPAYFTEMLATIGWPEGAVIMVGDNFEADIQPACTLGIPAYWIAGNGDYTQCQNESFLQIGTLEDFPAWLEAQDLDAFIPDFNASEASIAIQQATPAALSTLIGKISEEAWQSSASADSWNLTEICCHLRDVDREIYIPRIKQVIYSPRPFLEAVNADPWAEERGYKTQNGPQAFQEFVAARLELLNLIMEIPDTDWEKEIRHTIFGPISLPELFKISARHDKLHTQQIYQTIKSAAS